jgi:hypothetical protein
MTFSRGAFAAPIYADNLVDSQFVSSFGSGLVTGAPDGGGLWLGDTVDPPNNPGYITVEFLTALGDGAGDDLVVIDVASSPDETANVFVSSDNISFTLIGGIDAVNNSIDFAGYLGPVSYVKLVNTSSLKSIDIDAIYGNYAVPVPAAVWLFGSGLLGLVGMARRKKAA